MSVCVFVCCVCNNVLTTASFLATNTIRIIFVRFWMYVHVNQVYRPSISQHVLYLFIFFFFTFLTHNTHWFYKLPKLTD